MRYQDLRIIYFISPKYLLDDVKRCFAKLELHVSEIEETEDQWTLRGSKSNVSVTVSLLCEKKVVEPLIVFGEIPVSYLKAEIESNENFINVFKRYYEISLLRCLG